jgi:hypothetical protein
VSDKNSAKNQHLCTSVTLKVNFTMTPDVNFILLFNFNFILTTNFDIF